MNNEELLKRTEQTLKDLQKEEVSAILLVSIPEMGVQVGATHLQKFETGNPGSDIILEVILNLKVAMLINQMEDSNPLKKIGERLLDRKDSQEGMAAAIEAAIEVMFRDRTH